MMKLFSCFISATQGFNVVPAMRVVIFSIFLFIATLSNAQTQNIPHGDKKPADFFRVPLTVGMYVIDAAVAFNKDDREQGLMYRTQLAPNEGMLLVFDENTVHCLWMKNTLIPLSIAFIYVDGTISEIIKMEAKTETSHCSRNNVVYALEMGKGWFEAKAIKSGMKLNGLPQTQIR